VYYNSHYVSTGDRIQLSVLAAAGAESAGARDVIVEPARTLAVPYSHTARLRCLANDDDDDDDDMSWTWLVNGHPLNSPGQ